MKMGVSVMCFLFVSLVSFSRPAPIHYSESFIYNHGLNLLTCESYPKICNGTWRIDLPAKAGDGKLKITNSK